MSTSPASDQIRYFSGCRFNPDDGRLSPAGDNASAAPEKLAEQTVALRPQAARLLDAFLASPGEVLSRDVLIAAIWDEGSVVDFESGLAALMRELRLAFKQVGAEMELIETVPRRGYRFHGVMESPDPGARVDIDQPDRKGSHHQDGQELRPAMTRSAMTLLVLSIALGLAIIITFVFVMQSQRADVGAAGERENTTLAILPFETYLPERAAESRVGLLMADTLLARLWTAELEQLVLIGRATLRPYQGEQQVASLVARDLNVGLLLEGAVTQPAPSRWQVNARLLDMPYGTVLWSVSFELTADEVFPAAQAADQLTISLSEAWPQIRLALKP